MRSARAPTQDAAARLNINVTLSTDVTLTFKSRSLRTVGGYQPAHSYGRFQSTGFIRTYSINNKNVVWTFLYVDEQLGFLVHFWSSKIDVAITATVSYVLIVLVFLFLCIPVHFCLFSFRPMCHSVFFLFCVSCLPSFGEIKIHIIAALPLIFRLLFCENYARKQCC